MDREQVKIANLGLVIHARFSIYGISALGVCELPIDSGVIFFSLIESSTNSAVHASCPYLLITIP